MGYKMKYTNGKKADTSAFPFKIEAPNAISDPKPGSSPNKFGTLGALAGAGRAVLQGKGVQDIWGASLAGSLGMQGPDKQTLAEEDKYADVLAEEGLTRNFWGKLGFGGGNKLARESRIRDLQEQESQGIDRERILSRAGI
jgi:hypothetical protein